MDKGWNRLVHKAMTPFFDLLTVNRLDGHECAEKHFRLVVANSKLHFWQPGDPIADKGKRILIGAAIYSGYAMRLLDAVNSQLDQSREKTIRIDVFSTGDCKTHEDFGQYIPGLGIVQQTPVVGFWEDGALKEKAQGKAGRDLVIRVCGLDPVVEKQIVNLDHLAWLSPK